MDLSEKVANLPLSPGVYLMKDSLGNIIYVGKAKQLKKRVQSYFHQSAGHSPKVKQLVRNIRDLEYRLTDTEFEAFMLECRLIKEIKPMYNKKMKNPRAYTYIAVHDDGPYRRLEATYDPGDGCRRFGPYPSRSTVERALEGIQESQRILCSRPGSKGSFCLNHSLGLCIGMCGGGKAVQQYEQIIDKVIALLEGRNAEVLEELEGRMAQAAERFDFEGAAKYRDYTVSVQALLQKEQVIGFTGANRSIIVLEAVKASEYKLFLIKGSRILDSTRLDSSANPQVLAQEIQSAAIRHFGSPSSTNVEIGRDQVDEAQIIYSYLTSGPCSFVIVPDESLQAPEPLAEAVQALLADAMAKAEAAPGS